MPIGPAPDHLVRDSGGDGAAKADGRWHKVARDWGGRDGLAMCGCRKAMVLEACLSPNRPVEIASAVGRVSEGAKRCLGPRARPSHFFPSPVQAISISFFIWCWPRRTQGWTARSRLCINQQNGQKKRGRKYSRAWQAHHRPIADMLRSLQGPEIGNRNRENDAGSQANGRPAMDDIRAGPNPSSTTSERQSPPCLQLQLGSILFASQPWIYYRHDKDFSVKRRALLGCTNEAGDHGRLNLESASSARSDTPRPEFPGSQAGSVKRAPTHDPLRCGLPAQQGVHSWGCPCKPCRNFAIGQWEAASTFCWSAPKLDGPSGLHPISTSFLMI